MEETKKQKISEVSEAVRKLWS